MPGLRNKILINENGNQGRHAAMDMDGETLRMLSDEIEEMGLLDDKEVIDMQHDAERDCDAYDRAADKYIAARRKMIRRMYDRIERAREERRREAGGEA
jgi:protoporphyrinogen oxidase